MPLKDSQCLLLSETLMQFMACPALDLSPSSFSHTSSRGCTLSLSSRGRRCRLSLTHCPLFLFGFMRLDGTEETISQRRATEEARGPFSLLRSWRQLAEPPMPLFSFNGQPFVPSPAFSSTSCSYKESISHIQVSHKNTSLNFCWLRLLAESKGYRLDDTGLFLTTQSTSSRRAMRSSVSVSCKTEKEVFDMLGFPWLEPHERNL